MKFPAGFTPGARTMIAAMLACMAAACDPPESMRDELMGRIPNASSGEAANSSENATSDGALPAQPAFAWQAVKPSTIINAGPPAVLELSSGYAFIFYPSFAVSSGDNVTFRFRASGRQGKLRSVLMRHCGAGSEADSDSQVLDIGETAADYTLKHVFAEAHPCLRVTFQAIGPPNSITIHSWRLSVAPKATTTPAADATATAQPAASDGSKPSPAN